MNSDREEDRIPNQTKKKSRKNILIIVLGVLFLLASLVTGISLVKQNQQIKEKAATPGGTVRIFLSPETKSVQVEQVFSVNILLDSAGKYISALSIDLTYPFTDSDPPILATDIQINSSLVTNKDWNFPIKTISKEDQLVQIRIGGLNSSPSGYKTNGEETIATINFKAQKEGSINLTFNPTTTKATDKSTSEDILLTPSSTGSYTVQAGGLPSSNPTNTPTPTGAVGTNTPTPTGTANPSPTRTPVSVLTPSPSPEPAPESGVPFPTILGIGGGLILIISAIALTL